MKTTNDILQGTFPISTEQRPPPFLSQSLECLCRGILRSTSAAGLGLRRDSIPDESAIPTRTAEAMYPLALLYTQTGDLDLLAASKDLGNLLISRQKSDGYWVENESSQWHGCTIFHLVSLAATYKLLEKELVLHESKLWRNAIYQAADWVAAYEPVSHIEQTLVAIGERIPFFRRFMGRSISKRFFNTNYIATIPAALHYAWQVLGHEYYIERIPFFIKNVVEKSTSDDLIIGENMEVGPKLFKLARRTDSIDLGYNLDMTLGILAVYAEMADDNDLLEWVHQRADAHLTFFYPDGSMDNGVGIRGYKSVYFGSETAHGVQMLCSVLRQFDGKYDRVSELNAALIASSTESGVVQRGPFRETSTRATASLYPTFTRATCFALAIAHYSRRAPQSNTKLFFEETEKLTFFDSINSLVVKRSAFMATITGTRLHSSRIPYRFMTPPTGGSLSTLYHNDYGPIQLASPYYYQQVEPDFMPKKAESEPITPRIELIGTDYTNQHDTRVTLATSNGSITAAGRLTKRLTILRKNDYQIAYSIANEQLRKVITVNKIKENERIRLVEPIVLPDIITSSQLEDNVFTVVTNTCTLTLTVLSENPGSEIRLRPVVHCHAPPLRAVPIEIIMSGKGTVTASIDILVVVSKK